MTNNYIFSQNILSVLSKNDRDWMIENTKRKWLQKRDDVIDQEYYNTLAKSEEKKKRPSLSRVVKWAAESLFLA